MACVCIIDDKDVMRDSLTDILTGQGHEVVTFADPRRALEELVPSQLDVIISDLKMPGMSGEDLYDNVREIHPDLARRMIFSTGDVASEETQEFLRRCGNRYLQKPFDLVVIRSLIASVLSTRPN